MRLSRSQAGSTEQYIRQTHTVETITTSLYRPVDFRLPVGGGHLGDITGKARPVRHERENETHAHRWVQGEGVNE